jgi:tetratricopeptide (TPR) repeat protein
MTRSALRTSAALALVAALGACTHWSTDLDRIVDQSDRDFTFAPAVKYAKVDLADVMANPLTYVLSPIEFDFVYNRRNEQVFVPFWTTIKEQDYMGFSGWPAGSKLWEGGDRKSIPTLFMHKRHNPNLQALLDTSRYSLVRAKGWVMWEFEEMPFIEIQYYEVLASDVYSEQSLADMYAGLASVTQKRPAVAIQKLEASLAGVWTRSGRLLIHLQLGSLYAERGDWEAAATHYEAALLNDPAHGGAQAGLARARKELERKAAIESGGAVK